jgi:hypothetical protein
VDGETLLHDGFRMSAEVTPADIVTQNHYYIWFLLCGGWCSEKRCLRQSEYSPKE